MTPALHFQLVVCNHFRRMLLRGYGLLAMSLLLMQVARGQGVLTVTPGAAIQTVAGTGVVGYSGTTGANATLGNPAGVAYDLAGNLYFADTQNQVVRKLTPAGAISTVAGNGTEGFSGDGAAATAAQLDTPLGLTLDAAGNLYIADSFNNRVRMVSAATGNISTVVGTGATGYSGDGAAATAATLAHPAGLAFDPGGTLYIADAQNHVVRTVTNGVISTFAGNGTEGYAGDGAAATSAQLDTPVGVAVDGSAIVYIADRNNQVIRRVVGGNIITFAGNNTYSFAGDGGIPTSAALARPSDVAVDPLHHLFIADRDNDRIREVSTDGYIFTAAGNGVEQFAGDGGVPAAASLQQPRGVASDASGNVTFTDSFNQRVRQNALPLLSFGSVATGTTSAPQMVTLANTGSASLKVAPSFNGPFSFSNAGSCGAPPVTLAAGASCSFALVFTPTGGPGVAGSVVFQAGGAGAPEILLTGDEGTTSTTLKLAAQSLSATYGQAVTLSATLSATPAAAESVTFSSAGVSLGMAALNGSTATLTTSALPAGSDAVIATYGGDRSLSATQSNTVTITVAKAVPVLSWEPSTNQIPSGIAIPASVLDATASVPGTFSYTTTVNGTNTVLTAGSTVLPAGTYTFVLNFTPADATDYAAESATIPFAITTETVWLANQNSTFSVYSIAGAPITGTSGTAKANFGPPVSPHGLAFDSAGDAFVLSQGALYVYGPTLSNLSPTPVTGGGLSTGQAVAIDGAGQAWVTNANGTLSVFSNAGAAVSPASGYPGAAGVKQVQFLTIDSSGNVWVSTVQSGAVLVEQVLGAAAPVSPAATAVTAGTTGARP